MSVDASARARVVGITTQFRDLSGGAAQLLPQRVALIGQGSSTATYSLEKRQIFSSFEAATVYGFGSPLHLSALYLLPLNGDGLGTIPLTVYPLEDTGTGAPAVGSAEVLGLPTIAGAFTILINNIPSQQIVVTPNDDEDQIGAKLVEAINATLELPVTASNAISTSIAVLTSKWEGVSANELNITFEGASELGVTFALTQPVGGLVNPTVDDALAKIGNVWETFIVNCLNVTDSIALNTYEAFGAGRWGTTTKKPLMIISGNSLDSVSGATAISDARKTDYQNFQSVNPGSTDLPFIVASRAMARIAKVANEDPAKDYGSQQLTGLTPGADEDQWNYLQRDTALKGGSSTVEVKDGVVNISDTVTFFHPDGDPNPAYRYVCDVVKLQNIIYNTNLIFDNANWDGAPLIPDDQPTTNRAAKKPKTAKAAIAAMIDGLGLAAIIADPETAKQSIQANISPTNPKRLDVVFTVKLSGNANIISIDLNFGFFFGSAALV